MKQEVQMRLKISFEVDARIATPTLEARMRKTVLELVSQYSSTRFSAVYAEEAALYAPTTKWKPLCGFMKP